MDHSEGKSGKLFPQTMSIVKVVSPLKYKRSIIRELEQLGEVEPIQVDPRTGTDQMTIEDRRNQIEALRSRLSSLISSLDKKKIKKGSPLTVGQTEDEVINSINDVFDTHGVPLQDILKRKDEIALRQEELKGLKTLLEQLGVLGGGKQIKQSLMADTTHTKTFVGTVITSQTNRLYWYVSEVSSDKYFIIDQKLNDKETIALVTVLKEDAEATLAKLKSMNFQDVTLPKDVDLDGLSISDCDEEYNSLEKETKDIEKQVSEYSKEHGYQLIAALEACEIELQRIGVEVKMRRTQSTCVLWAWLPEDNKELFRTAMHQATEGSSIVDFRKGDLDPEVTPSYTKNSKFMDPMRGLVTSFGTPGAHEVDPYPFVKFLFPILFGIMFADVGHGFLLTLAGLYAYNKKKKMDEMPKGISGYFYGGAELLIIMGITSFFMGFAFNSIFGDETLLWQVSPIRAIFEGTTWKIFFHVETVLHDDGHGHVEEIREIERNYVNFLIFSFAMGALVILIGLGLNLYQLSKHRHSDAELQAAATLTGVYVFAIIGALFSALGLSAIGLGFIVLSIVSIFATLTIEYRAHQIDGLMLGVDHVISLLSNTFSFGRLLAMNTIHFVLAFLPYLFMDKSDMFHGILNHNVDHISWFENNTLIMGWVIAALIGSLIVLPVETTFSTLQALRLSWVEFFGKFYKGQGIEFKPVKVNRIHTIESDGK